MIKRIFLFLKNFINTIIERDDDELNDDDAKSYLLILFLSMF